jgi:SAM-dependent methyltransferase
MEDAAKRVADYWATNHKISKYRSWLEHPTVIRYVNRRITGDPELNGVTWFQRKYLPETVDVGLSLGCGFGAFERAAIEMKIAHRFHANDLSPGAIATATAEAANAGMSERIEYSVINMDADVLPCDAYDVVFGLASIHHVFNLEHLFKRVRASMKPGALFYLDEYIGPSRFQTPAAAITLINDIRAILPAKLRYDLFSQDGSLISTYSPSGVEHFELHDPSEAVRSSEIVSVLKMYFDIVEYRPYGGTLLHMLLTGITGNFDENNEDDDTLLKLLTLMDVHLEHQLGGPDHAVIVARPKR